MILAKVLCFFIMISRDAAQRWPFIDSLIRDEPSLDYVETQHDYGDANEAYFDNAIVARRYKGHCIEEVTYFNVSDRTKGNISGISYYPIRYRDVTCKVSNSQQDAALYSTCNNRNCVTTHGKIPVFIRVGRTGCWEFLESIPIEAGCMCGR